jgi:hypothetical protein
MGLTSVATGVAICNGDVEETLFGGTVLEEAVFEGTINSLIR